MTTSSATVPTAPSTPTATADVQSPTEVAAPAEPRALSPEAARGLFRAGLRAPTSGWCAGWTQINLISVPRRSAYDLLLFAQRNPKPCPVLDVSEPGGTSTELFGGDLRTDLPAYRIYERGELVAEVPDVRDVWREDLVSFLVGCSFTFEAALVEAGVPIRHQEAGTNVPMYRTNLRTRSAGDLAGPLVVSMRPVPAALVAAAVRVTARYPAVHGAPVHVGSPAEIGVRDLDAPDFGDPAEVRPGDVPIFWACGVTPQAAVMESKPEFAIGHAPGHMGITDARDNAFLVP